MSIKFFFKLYLLPFFVVLSGIAIYTLIVVWIDQKSLRITQYHRANIQNIDDITNGELALSTPLSIDLLEENLNDIPLDETNTENLATNTTEIPVDILEIPTDSENQESETNNLASLNLPQIDERNEQNPVSPTQVPQIAESAKVYRYAKARINIRRNPSSESPVISRANTDESLEVIGESLEWSKVRNAAGVEGYVATRLLKLRPNPTSGEMYIVIPNTLNVRLHMDRTSPIIGHLTKNMRVDVLEINGEWAKIQLPNKQYGYTALSFLAKEP
uniref:SH3b domain-containing protein n=1 Tax=uncultured Helicobacter sp. TaxID=175537 RepID=A0A650EN00_9HELI|nr:hypothetical protein Helico6505_0760 [uncultured Helicobacter sp.]